MHERFDRLLLDLIRHGHNEEAAAMLNTELAQAARVSDYDSDYHGTLLHHAAMHNNAAIARRLIELGADVNRLEGCRITPLTRAVEHHCEATVRVLLRANARVDVLNEDGGSALQDGLDCHFADSEIFKLLAARLRAQARTSEQLAEALMSAGCNAYHAAALRDVGAMECMLRRGVDVDSRDATELTALHAAVKLDDANLAGWLLDNGADIDARDEADSSALRMSVENGNTAMLRLLLDRGACPNVKGDMDYEETPLYEAFVHLDEAPDESLECAELLLQRGAAFPDPAILRRMLDLALSSLCDKAAKLLIAHLAMLEMLGEPVDKSALHSVDGRHREAMSELRKYYDSCQRVLATNVFGDSSLLNLFNESDRKLKSFVRKETFFQRLESFSYEYKFRELYSYYLNKMMRCLEKPSRVVRLENEAIPVICKMFKAGYNYFYFFARALVEYLDERDLENLIQV